tara:strand:- start:646 stop:810 length:165 start_codon:yes stop_codon:yes gene_type:complete
MEWEYAMTQVLEWGIIKPKVNARQIVLLLLGIVMQCQGDLPAMTHKMELEHIPR